MVQFSKLRYSFEIFGPSIFVSLFFILQQKVLWSPVVYRGLPWSPVAPRSFHVYPLTCPREATGDHSPQALRFGFDSVPTPLSTCPGEATETTGDTSPWASRFEFGNEPTRSRDTAIDMGDRGGPHIPRVSIFGFGSARTRVREIAGDHNPCLGLEMHSPVLKRKYIEPFGPVSFLGCS